MKLLLDDIVVVSKTVDVPENCACGADFRECGLDLYEFQLQTQTVGVIEVREAGNPGLDYSSLPSPGDACMPQAWACPKCKAIVAKGALHEYDTFNAEGDAHSPPEALKVFLQEAAEKGPHGG